ncbi:MAG: hypothetical protein IJN08_02425 [Clostridia bacterium]|nr:hypothetical protein [Clostridia bacterium]
MDYRLSRKIMWIGIDAGMVLLAASMCFKNEKIQVALMVAAVGVFAIGILQAFLFYKCPKCGCRLLKYTGGIPENCPKCEAYLALEDKYEKEQAQQREDQENNGQQ